MNAAAIDVGSNTVRLLIAHDKDGFKPVLHERKITRMASNIDHTGRLDPTGARDTLTAIKGFLDTVSDNGVPQDRLLVAGTSALREADNAEELLSEVRSLTGVSVKVLTSEEEARATSLGVLSVFPETDSAFLLDIGGGSTEAIVIFEGKVHSSCSRPVGVVKLIDRHIHSDPPRDVELRELSIACEDVAGQIWRELGKGMGAGAVFIATAGTATTAASIDLELEVYDRGRVEGHVIEMIELENMFRELSVMPMSGRRIVKGLEKGREDLIIPGLALTIEIMEAAGISTALACDTGLLDGLCLEAMAGAMEG